MEQDQTSDDNYIYAYAKDDPDGPYTENVRKISVSPRDGRSFHSTPRENRRNSGWLEVTDLETGELLFVRWASCGLNCYCAAEWAVSPFAVVA